MRILRFIVNDTAIIQDPDCNFNGMFPGKEKEVMAEFVFSEEWNKRVKVAAFWSITGAEYTPQILDDGETCMIPVEALLRPAFKVQILGKQKGKKIETTNKITVYQSGGKT